MEPATCPHCDKESIIVRSRGCHSRGWPAVCRECGGLAYDRPHGAVTTLLAIADILAPYLLVGVWAAFPGTFGYAALFSIPFFIAYWWCQRGKPRRIRPFRPISSESSRLSRRLTLLAIFAVISGFVLLAAVVITHA